MNVCEFVSKDGPLPTSMQYWYMFNLFWAQLISFFYFILVLLGSLKCLISPFFVFCFANGQLH